MYRAVSAVVSASGVNVRQKVTIWPEWNDADILGEKWTTLEASKKEDKKSVRSPVQSQHFDDPEGKIELPHSLKAETWKRPVEFIHDKIPVIRDQDFSNGFDLITTNEHLHESEFLRHCISQIIALWEMTTVTTSPESASEFNLSNYDPTHTWSPWEHIYSFCKSVKGPNMPVYNPYGKYAVKLYWMGCWRKIIIDDSIPFDSQGRMLLPSTALQNELWPMLLTKALIKVASLDFTGGNPNQEFGDVSVIQCLTGWIPEAIPLHKSHMNEVWELLKACLPEWKPPLQDWEKPSEDVEALSKDMSNEGVPKDEKSEKESFAKEGKEKVKDKKDKGGKDDKKDKKDKGSKGKEKDKTQEEKVAEESFLPEKPEVVFFATYSTTSQYPTKVSVLGEMADASEKLRQNGLSHMYPHPVVLSQTRTCPLEPPPPPVVVPSWKLIRPRKKKIVPLDEVSEPEEPKPIQCLKINSPFLNYKVSAVPIPADTHRPKSSLDRGGTRSRAEGYIIEEGEENVPTPPHLSPEPQPVALPSLLKQTSKEEDTAIQKPKQRRHSKDRKVVTAPKNKTIGKASEVSVDTKNDLKSKEGSKSDQPVFGESGGLAPPASLINGKSDIILEDEETLAASTPTIETYKMKSGWMDFDDFMKCFRTLYVYHKPNTYLCNQRFSDLKSVSASSPNIASKAEKKSHHISAVPTDSTAPFYLFVDNLAATDIVVSFSVLARWFEPPSSFSDDRDRKPSLGQSKEKDLDKDASPVQNLDDKALQVQSDPKSLPAIVPGSLVAEPYSWKSLVTGHPILRLKTTGTKSAVLSLPPGRHVLRFLVTSPLGHHVHMCSTVPFVLGDEETVMPHLTSESFRFRESAVAIITNLGKCIQGFSDSEQFKAAWKDLVASHCPYLDNKQMSKQHHFEIFNDALYQMLWHCLKDVASPDIAFAWRAFTFDVTTPNILQLPLGSRPGKLSPYKTIPVVSPYKTMVDETPETRITKSTNKIESQEFTSRNSANFPNGQRMSKPGSISAGSRTAFDERLSATASHRSSGRISVKKHSQAEPGELEKTESIWSQRQPSITELTAAVKINKTWRGYYVRKVKKARTPGTEENAKASENLKKCWSLIEAHLEENGLFLLREMLRRDPNIMPYYPFYKDEWSRISYTDYKGTFADQPPMSWFVIFRDIFYVRDEMLVVPTVNVPINNCILHVVDNDTGKEIPRVFQKVAPYVYTKNKKGYSFVAEARTHEQPLPSGNWRLRLIGSLSGLPTTPTGDVCNYFMIKEIMYYYVPNNKNILFRMIVYVKDDHFVSLQMNTSKRGVYFKLAVLDNEEEVISAVGKGHVVIPAFTFLKNVTQEDIDNRRSGSRASFRTSPAGHFDADEKLEEEDEANKNSSAAAPTKGDKTPFKSKRAESAAGNDQMPASRNSVRSDAELAERLEDTKVHKYIIQATVLQNSWPLSENNWRFVQELKELEKNEQKLTTQERPASPPKVDKVQATGGKAKVKGGKEKTGKDKGQENKGPRPISQQFDLTKPHWTLRVVSDSVVADEIELKKDTERIEEIRAMKKAWEEAEPGRTAKALQSRMKYLNSHTIKIAPSENLVEPVKIESLTSLSSAGTENLTSSSAEYESSQTSFKVIPPVFFNESESSLTLEPPPSLQPKQFVERVDITPFIKKTLPEPIFVDEEVIQMMMEKQQKKIAEFNMFREEVEKWREADKIKRNLAKMRQLEQYQALQEALDVARERINTAREAIRQRFLEAEKLRLEEIAKENALKAEFDGASSKAKPKNTEGKKKK